MTSRSHDSTRETVLYYATYCILVDKSSVGTYFLHLPTLTEVFTLAEVFLNLTEVFLTLTEVFPCFFLSCKANARVKLAKTGYGPHSTTLVVICVVLCIGCVNVLFPTGDNPIAINKYIVSCIFVMSGTHLLSQPPLLKKHAHPNVAVSLTQLYSVISQKTEILV